MLWRDFFGIGAQEIWGPKTTFFDTFASLVTLSLIICGLELDRDNWEMALKTTEDPLHCPKILWTYDPLWV